MDCAGAEQSASDLHFAMPVSAPLRTSPALSLTLRRRFLPGMAGAIPPRPPAHSSALRRHYLSRCAGAILCAKPAPSLALRQRECRRNEEGSANQARGRAPAQCEIERRGRERNSTGDARKRVQADLQTKHGLSKVCSLENWSTPHSEKFEYKHSNNTKCCRFNTSRIK